jgi:hypothetical protein
MHRDANTAFEMRDDVVGRAHDGRAFGGGVGRRSAAHEILQTHRKDGTRRGVVARRIVGEAHHVADALGVQERPVGATRIRHADERNRLARDPVEIIGHAQLAEPFPGVRAGRNQLH